MQHFEDEVITASLDWSNSKIQLIDVYHFGAININKSLLQRSVENYLLSVGWQGNYSKLGDQIAPRFRSSYGQIYVLMLPSSVPFIYTDWDF